MNELTKKIKEHVNYMEKAHVNDLKTTLLLDEIEQFLMKDVKNSIISLNELDLISIEWICSRFEKISYEIQDKDFINCLDNLLTKFAPDINGFKNEIQEAKDVYYGN